MANRYKQILERAILKVRDYTALRENEKWVATRLLSEARLMRKQEFQKDYIYPQAFTTYHRKMKEAHEAIALARRYNEQVEEYITLAHLTLGKLSDK